MYHHINELFAPTCTSIRTLQEHFSDLVYEVGLRNAGRAYICVLFEHKSYVDSLSALQVLRYMVQGWEYSLRQQAQLWPVIPVVVYHGAVFGPDPFVMASEAEGREVDEIIIRTGRHLGGLVSLRRAEEAPQVRLNVHTAHLFGANTADENLKVEVFALYDIQLTKRLELPVAAEIVAGWRG